MLPTRVPRADDGYMEDTQEAGGSNGCTSAQSENIQNKIAFKVIEEMLHLKKCHCMWNSFGQNSQGVGYDQVCENQVHGL